MLTSVPEFLRKTNLDNVESKGILKHNRIISKPQFNKIKDIWNYNMANNDIYVGKKKIENRRGEEQ